MAYGSALGGKAVDGAAVGILILEARFPRIPGDAGHADRRPLPVHYPTAVFCRLAAGAGVPVAISALMEAPLIEGLLPPGKRVGILTISRATLPPTHLATAGGAPETPVIGTEGGREFSRVILNDEPLVNASGELWSYA